MPAGRKFTVQAGDENVEVVARNSPNSPGARNANITGRGFSAARPGSSPQSQQQAPRQAQRVTRRVVPIWKRLFMRNNQRGQNRMESTLKSPLYQFFVFCFTIYLLFGAEVKNLWLHRSLDHIFDILTLITFGFFIFDIILRMCVSPNYFAFQLCKFPTSDIAETPQPGAGSASLGTSARSHTSTGSGPEEKKRSVVRFVSDIVEFFTSFQIGSFLFWLDLLSTVALLYEIKLINSKYYEHIEIDIALDLYGIPFEGLQFASVNRPVELQRKLLIVIAKTARVSRFVRSSRVAKLSSKINWYWCLQNLSPSGIYTNFTNYKESLRHGKANRSTSSNELLSTLVLGLSASVQANKSGTSGHEGSMRSGGLAGLLGGPSNPASSGSAVAKVFRVLFAPIRFVLEMLGIVPSRTEEFRRQVAATRIQRAWRAAMRRHAVEMSEHHSSEISWRADGSRLSKGEQKLRKRSALRQFANMNNDKLGTASRRSGSSLDDSSMGGQRRGGRRPNNGGQDHDSPSGSQVGAAMREITGQRVALGIIVGFVLTVLFTYSEPDATRSSTMIVLHTQTKDKDFAFHSLKAARDTSIPDLFEYTLSTSKVIPFLLSDEDQNDLRDRETIVVRVQDPYGRTTIGRFAYRKERREEALVELLSTIFILMIWMFGIRAFVGPVMILVVIPIERMVRLLEMMTINPLGYQNTSRYRKFLAEEDQLTKNTRWTKEVLKGMETSFLMSTILRIGSLMKVGFGSAGVEIIRQNLEKSQTKDQSILSNQGMSVSCIFLFCDIRQFTDATESLQEEVFRFTNRIAAVVHSYCHAYGGAANKNVGDAFLLSWLLDENMHDSAAPRFGGTVNTFSAKSHQADKALLSVVKICMALEHNSFYLETLSNAAKERLLEKLSKRKGPVVQMGCGLHAGKAVQGAIGSERKIDATYVSESVERSEFLESSTKKYGVKVLMSDNFHDLLDTNNKRRCRKVDQIIIVEDADSDDELEEDEILDMGEVLELYTFDMDIEVLWRPPKSAETNAGDSVASDTESSTLNDKQRRKNSRKSGVLNNPAKAVRRSMNRMNKQTSDGDLNEDTTSGHLADGGSEKTGGFVGLGGLAGLAGVTSPRGQVGGSESGGIGGGDSSHNADTSTAAGGKKISNWTKPVLVLPTGPALYNSSVWQSGDIPKIRKKFFDGNFPFFQQFQSGLQAFYCKDWRKAKQYFSTILEHFEDGPSRYFITQIEANNGRPPKGFIAYGRT